MVVINECTTSNAVDVLIIQDFTFVDRCVDRNPIIDLAAKPLNTSTLSYGSCRCLGVAAKQGWLITLQRWWRHDELKTSCLRRNHHQDLWSSSVEEVVCCGDHVLKAKRLFVGLR
jgi:hypothetical protein